MTNLTLKKAIAIAESAGWCIDFYAEKSALVSTREGGLLPHLLRQELKHLDVEVRQRLNEANVCICEIRVCE
jgi:hypothetical protein